MKNPKFLNIALGAIQIEAQHRKTFDQNKVIELSESIREKGVLQPIIVRTIEGEPGYHLVCGERRHRACMLIHESDSSLLVIPSLIHENLSDEDALEMQITENLQREDVHPMEEAQAFKDLMINKKYSLEELAKRMGKTIYYIGQRLKLMELIEPLQAAVFEDRMTIKMALLISKFNHETQHNLWDKRFANRSGNLELSTWELNQYMGNLKTATFPLDNEALDAVRGACSNCPYNTAAAGSLFPEDAKEARCLMISCYEGKTKKHFEEALFEAQNDETAILVVNEYGNPKSIEQLTKKGHKVYLRNDYEKLDEPENPGNFQEFKSANYSEVDDTTDEEIQQSFDKDTLKFQKSIKSFEKKLATGQYHKAFIVAGDGIGRNIYVNITKKQAKEKGKDLTAAAAKSEIIRLQERQKRSEQLDDEKVLPRIHSLVAAFDLDEDAVKQDLKDESNREMLHRTELNALVILLYNHMKWNGRNGFYEVMGYEESDDEDNAPLFYGFVENLPEKHVHQAIAILTRQLIIDHMVPGKNSSWRTSNRMLALMKVAQHMRGSEVDEILLEQRTIADKRNARIYKRIADLENFQPKPKNDKKTAAKAAPEKAAPAKKKAAKKK